MGRSRKFCFTVNNYTPDDEEALRKLAGSETVVYLIYGKEVGSKCGTPHLQGFVYYRNPRHETAVRKSIRGHVEVANGTVDQNVAYVSKDGDCTVYGEKPLSDVEKGRAAKRDWGTIVAQAEAGKTEEFKSDHPDLYFRCLKTFKSHRKFNIDPLEHGTRHLWLFGPTGTGKSYRARQHTPFYNKLINKWWDGYEGEDNVIIEEWSPDNDKTTQRLKLWADRYDFPAEVKGGYIRIRPRLIIVTSNYDMRQCFPRDEDYLPLKRRFQEVYCSSWDVETEM